MHCCHSTRDGSRYVTLAYKNQRYSRPIKTAFCNATNGDLAALTAHHEHVVELAKNAGRDSVTIQYF